jgi:hypothetical protein
MNDQQNFFKLLKYSNELKKNKKSLRKEDPEAFNVLLNFSVTIEDNLHYLKKQEYIQLAKDFLADQITKLLQMTFRMLLWVSMKE